MCIINLKIVLEFIMQLSAEILDGVIKKEDKVVAAVSGGADSMCLLSLLNEKRKDISFSLFAVHVNHNIRDKEAIRDEKFVEEFCKVNNIGLKIVHVKALDYAKKFNKSIEQAARELRYEALNEVMLEIKANKLFVAHHIGDQAETVLMHIFRGSSIKGARGMSIVSGKIIRPLLFFSKEEILEYNKKHNVVYVEDSTNSDINYTRNFLRQEIIPRLETVYPGVKNAICAFSNRCDVDDEFIESMLPLGLIEIDRNKTTAYLKSEVKDLHLALSTRLIKKAFEGLNIYADIEMKHINQILDLFDMKNGNRVDLPVGATAYKEYDRVVITNKRVKNIAREIPFGFGEVEFKGFGKLCVCNITGKEDPEFGDGNHYLDLDSIPLGAVWRTRREGDTFKKLGAGNKKLNDYFTDKKVPLRLRDTIPVLAEKSTILAVFNLDIADGVKITDKTEQIVKIT